MITRHIHNLHKETKNRSKSQVCDRTHSTFTDIDKKHKRQSILRAQPFQCASSSNGLFNPCERKKGSRDKYRLKMSFGAKGNRAVHRRATSKKTSASSSRRGPAKINYEEALFAS